MLKFLKLYWFSLYSVCYTSARKVSFFYILYFVPFRLFVAARLHPFKTNTEDNNSATLTLKLVRTHDLDISFLRYKGSTLRTFVELGVCQNFLLQFSYIFFTFCRSFILNPVTKTYLPINKKMCQCFLCAKVSRRKPL